jgi:osmotically inducible protein OsmC
MATRNGSAQWNGDLKTGSGRLTVGEGAWEGDYSFSSRFEEGAGTNPEELLAAAHAACFTMQLSHLLAEHGHGPRSVKTAARVHLRNIDGTNTIQEIELETEGDVPGIDEDHFRVHAEEAKAGCIVSRALAGVEQISLSARLVST